jgi:hypothetical protein
MVINIKARGLTGGLTFGLTAYQRSGQKKTPRDKEVRKPGGLLIVRWKNTNALIYGRFMVKNEDIRTVLSGYIKSTKIRPKDQVFSCPFLLFMT